jgi:hypothetical protein
LRIRSFSASDIRRRWGLSTISGDAGGNGHAVLNP